VSLSVMVRSLVYIVDRTAHSFLSTKVDLTSSVPTAGNQCLVGLFLKDDDTIEVVASTAQTMDDPLDLTDIQECITGSSQNSTPVWAWQLQDAQTTITDKTVNFGLRDVISITGARNRPPAIPGGRLTLTSGNPLATGISGATTLYYTPYTSDGIELWTGYSWTNFTFTESSLALGSLNANTLYDIYCYANGSALTLEALSWTAPTNGAITGATNATPIVVTYTGTDPSNNEIVTIAGVGGNTAANGDFRVANINTGAKTFELTTLAGANVAGTGAYTSGGTWSLVTEVGTRATALATLNGRDVKSGDATRRYLGTIKINSTGGQTDFLSAKRLVWNRYNQVWRTQNKSDSTSHTYSSATKRPWNNDLGVRVETVIGMAIDIGLASIQGRMLATVAGDTPQLSFGLDNPIGFASAVFQNSNTQAVRGFVTQGLSLAAGYHYLQATEWSDTGGGTLNVAVVELELPM
jgi:hypothetical protein